MTRSRRMFTQAKVLSGFLTLVAATLFLSCGRGSAGSRLSAPTEQAASKKAAVVTRDRRVPLDDVMHQIDACPAPENVDPQLFASLKQQLKNEFIKRSDGKYVSIAPHKNVSQNQVTDLEAQFRPYGSQATLKWTEKLWGDFTNDGEVFITDLQPIALYSGMHSNLDDGPPGHRLVVGDILHRASYQGDIGDDPNGSEIGIQDLDAIAVHYGERLDGYRVYRGVLQYDGTVAWDTSPPYRGYPAAYKMKCATSLRSTRPFRRSDTYAASTTTFVDSAKGASNDVSSKRNSIIV